MKKEIVESYTACDVCGNLFGHEDQFELRGSMWDACRHCAEKLEAVLSFLTLTVGIDIPYRHPPSTAECDAGDHPGCNCCDDVQEGAICEEKEEREKRARTFKAIIRRADFMEAVPEECLGITKAQWERALNDYREAREKGDPNVFPGLLALIGGQAEKGELK